MQKHMETKRYSRRIYVSATYVAYICAYIYIISLYIYVCHIETTYLIETTSTRISAILPASKLVRRWFNYWAGDKLSTYFMLCKHRDLIHITN